MKMPWDRAPKPEPAPVKERVPGEQSFVTRHSIKPKGEDKESAQYPGISGKGAEKAQERSKELLDMLEKAPKGAVMFIAGASELIRTKSTGEAYGDGMKDLLEGRDDIEVITRSQIMEDGAPEGYTNAVKQITDRIAANPDKKFVVDFPLYLKGLSASHFVEADGKTLKPYFVKMGEQYGDDEYVQVAAWLHTRGKMPEGEPQGPDPVAIAEGIEDSLKRLREFGKKQLGDRPLIVGMVGHSWLVDAFLLQAALGEITEEGFHRMTGGRKMIKETEAGFVEIDDNDMVRVSYRGNNFKRELNKQSYEG